MDQGKKALAKFTVKKLFDNEKSFCHHYRGKNNAATQ